MANFICEFEGVRGRNLKLYDTKIIITTKMTVGSLITGNFTDGEKTIYLCDVVGVQHKKSGLIIGYLQFETPSMQMNNKSDNMFSENTFTYESGKNGITNELIEAVYEFVTDRIEELKYGSAIINAIPDFESMKVHTQNAEAELTENHDVEAKHAVENNDSPKFMKKQKMSAWDHWNEKDSSFGKCEICKIKNLSLLFVEYEDSAGKHQKNICYDCFCERDCRPVEERE